MSEFDPADFDAPPPTKPTTRAAAQAKAQSASATAFFDRVPAQLSEVMATLASLGVTDTEIKALLKKIGANLVDPKTAYQYAYSGSQKGAQETLKATTEELVTKVAHAVSAPIQTLTTKLDSDLADRSRMAQEHAKHQKRQWIYLGLLALPSLLLPLVGLKAYDAGVKTGTASSRDEVAAASWANTSDGQAAYRLYKSGVLALVVNCSGKGWIKENGYCFANRKGKRSGWLMP
jgi:Tfp pilus assembly protein PilX